jgi:hypothetical protein
MSYQSVDKLQKALAETVFGYAVDKKKAAGRALGTLVEIITFYTLKSWGFRDSIAIERPLAEYANPEITHNVEYSLHPVLWSEKASWHGETLPLSTTKLQNLLPAYAEGMEPTDRKGAQLLTRDGVLRNACVMAVSHSGPLVAHLDSYLAGTAELQFTQLHRDPYAIFECKRVGIEEGMRKGPQTIEKAKQGAYVARSVSSLQKMRMKDGRIGGVIHRGNRGVDCEPYEVLLRKVIDSHDSELLDGFILTAGVVSNHGNWFTSENQNKELKVLAQSYDWLLFLTDQGLSEFIDELLLNPAEVLRPAREAFRASYTGRSGKNRFTKVQMDLEADRALQHFFDKHRARVEKWFNVITPKGASLTLLLKELTLLRDKDWKTLRQP